MTGFERLGERIAAEQDRLRAQLGHAQSVREAIVAAALPGPHHEAGEASFVRRPFVLAAFAGLAAAGVLLALALAREPARAPLAAFVGGASDSVPSGTWIEASKASVLPIRFSDGTRIELSPRSRARLVDLRQDGAQLMLESGLARVHVRHRPHADWRLSVGPFAVRVTGTRFDLRWNPEPGEMELVLTEGHVVVEGCVFGQGYAMRAGQTARASCKSGRLDVVETKSELATQPAPPAARPLVEPAVVAEPARATGERAAVRGGRRGGTDLGWRELAARGRYVDAFELASDLGFEKQCAAASVSELELLAQSARFAGEPQREAYALHLLRRRFAGSRNAALAAFELGRLEFDGRGSYRKAAEWFRAYLKEDQGGALAREARGRILEATLRTGDAEAARKLAASYLRAYPQGPHADLARGVLAQAAP